MDSASFFNFIIASSSNPVKLSKKASRMSRTFLVFHHNPEQYLSNAFAMRGQAHGENRDTGRNLSRDVVAALLHKGGNENAD